ncbi:penicillin-binding protein 2 [Calidifontibacter sp. DB0510]|uniref:Penicillin-binding protein 2 n=2 Tax=Metallococcus carri TaxID=1656884 RepID=A0A967AZL5_9MICO|nr:penicillin-binding protein 2 [Metallococcus carri]NOP37504.1 penicillin-binding protein 2 [Calidifontibacter sp. DB2511S]
MFVLTLFVGQLFRIQGLEASTLAAQAVDSRIARTTIPALRGQITDANGVVLANSVERYDVTADPQNIRQYYGTEIGGKLQGDGFAKAATALSSITGAAPQDIVTALKQADAKKLRFVYLVRSVTPDQWNRINDLHIPGIYSERTVARQYPQGTTVAPLLGWVSANGKPGGGVEAIANGTLNGKPGVRTYEQAPDGTVIATGDQSDSPALDGNPVQLTIDNDLQWYAQNAIAGAVKKYKALSGDAIIMDVKGNLRAVASYPSFDNNSLASASPAALQSAPFVQAYEPGSTSKVITMAALLAQGKATPQSQFVVPNRLKRAGTSFKDSHEHPTLNLTLAGILAESSNIGTIEAGEKLDPATLYGYMRKFGLGSTSGIGYPGETAGILAPYQKWSGSTRYTVMFGQGLSGSAIQQASVFQAIANGGVREPVKLLAGVGKDGKLSPPQDSRKAVTVVSPQVATQVTNMMAGVVGKDGTAKAARVPGYNVAGKTGTADRYDPTLGRYNGQTASFIGFAPAENPQFIIAVTLQRPTAGSIYGGEVAAPVFSDLMGYALRRNHVPPSTAKTQEYPLTYDPKKSVGR